LEHSIEQLFDKQLTYTIDSVTSLHEAYSMQQLPQHPFNSPFSGTTWVSTRKVKTGAAVASAGPYANLHLTLQPEPHHLVFFRPDAFPATQPCQSTEGNMQQ